jgi:Arc/MetJ-type ribon-helix-helix transcriptional regulator
MKPLLVRLPEELYAQLKQNRQLTGTSAAEYIRRAVRLALFADSLSANPQRCEQPQLLEPRC